MNDINVLKVDKRIQTTSYVLSIKSKIPALPSMHLGPDDLWVIRVSAKHDICRKSVLRVVERLERFQTHCGDV